MSEKLKPCPLCGGEAFRSSPGTIDIAWCSVISCEMNCHTLTVRNWQSLPRRDETAAEIAKELMDLVKQQEHQNGMGAWCVSVRPEHLQALASRLRNIAAPGECEHCGDTGWIDDRDGGAECICKIGIALESAHGEARGMRAQVNHWRNEYKTLELSAAMAVADKNKAQHRIKNLISAHADLHEARAERAEAERDEAREDKKQAGEHWVAACAEIEKDLEAAVKQRAALEAAVGTVCGEMEERLLDEKWSTTFAQLPSWFDTLRAAIKGTEQIPGPICRSCSLDNICDVCLEDVEVSWRLCDGCYQKLKSTPPPPNSVPTDCSDCRKEIEPGDVWPLCGECYRATAVPPPKSGPSELLEKASKDIGLDFYGAAIKGLLDWAIQHEREHK